MTPAASRSPDVASTIDAHVHVWGEELLDAAWLAAPAARPIRRAFGLGDLAPELVLAGVRHVVLVAADERDCAAQRLLAGAADDPRVAAVVAGVDLTAPDVGTRLAALRAGPGGTLLRGVRQSLVGAPDSWWSTSAVAVGLAAVQRAGLLLELLISPEQLPEAAALAQRCPSLPVVVDHLANAARPGTDLAAWRRALTQLARAPLAVAKLSSLGTDERTAVTLAGDARAVLGADRLLWGSDWPVLLLRDDYRGERARLDRLLAGWTPAERAAVLGGTAARVYGTLR
ncbi:amidohydrolase family protein [Micromonospora sp. DH14]|uniref:amidohydrolase family protein n=1 Tax=Micromonospora sp. DH14 TaxID=3040120 RepID=UPI0024412659|nr:amidohydrolase family protein [Micromonospora sp. DH14]MDG9674172.1 amidohydrolase family protein [Micromonospora sp. DH14]